MASLRRGGLLAADPGSVGSYSAAGGRGSVPGGPAGRDLGLACDPYRPSWAPHVGRRRFVATGLPLVCGGLHVGFGLGAEGVRPKGAGAVRNRDPAVVGLWLFGSLVGARAVHLSLRLSAGGGRAAKDGPVHRRGGTQSRQRTLGRVLQYRSSAAQAATLCGLSTDGSVHIERLRRGFDRALQDVYPVDL